MPGSALLVDGDAQEDVAQQSEGYAHRADHQVFPRGFHGALVPVEIDEGGRGQGGQFDADPESPQIACERDQRHGRAEKAEAGEEACFGSVGEEFAFLDIALYAPFFFAFQIADSID